MARTLESFDFIKTYMPLKHLQFPLQEANHPDLMELASLGVEMEIQFGRVMLKYEIKPFCKLIAKEIQSIANDYIYDFMELHEVKFWDGWEVEWISPYLSEDTTLERVLEQISLDWRLEDEEMTKLAQKRSAELMDDPANQI